MTQKHPDRVDESLIALRRILRATELYARDLAQAAGVTPAQLRVLQIVGEKKDPTAKTLATQMGVSQATVTALVDKLVARGLVTRLTSAQDRRQTNITLTHEGEADQALAAAGQVDAAVAAGEQLPSLLAGVPLALKDVFTATDMPTTCGSSDENSSRRR